MQLDGGNVGTATNPKSYANLAVGTHTFTVYATDPAGNADASPATYQWTVIVGTPLEIWRETYFNSLENIGDGADTFDFDHDGLTNLMEFALGSDPTRASDAPPPVAAREGGFLTFTYIRSAAASGILTFSPEATDDLGAPWDSAGVTEEILSDDGTTRQV